jgi:hypothetical protein
LEPVETVPELPRVAVVESDPALSAQLAARLTAASFATVDDLEAEIAPDELVVVVLGPSCATVEGLIQVARLTRDRPRVRPVLLARYLATGLLQRALRAGVRDVVTSQ